MNGYARDSRMNGYDRDRCGFGSRGGSGRDDRGGRGGHSKIEGERKPVIFQPTAPFHTWCGDCSAVIHKLITCLPKISLDV